MMMPNLLIGVLLYKSDLTLLTQLVKGLFQQRFSDSISASTFRQSQHWAFQIILWDNDDGKQIESVQKHFQNTFTPEENQGIHYHASPNIGFAQGHNGIFTTYSSQFPCDYYLCLNPDGIPHPDLFQHFFEFIKKNEHKHAKPGLYEARQFPSEHPKKYDPETGETQWVSGCCLLVPKTLYEKLGGFDPRFFMYMEDVDLSWRCQILGYACYTVQNALFFHHRKPDPEQTKRINPLMWHAGYLLATKYGLKPFRDKIWRQMRLNIPPAKITEIKQEAARLKESRYWGWAEKFPNLITGEFAFHFSEVRW